MKELPENLKNKIRAVAAAINSLNCVVHTMIFSIGKNDYGYQPHPGPKKRKYCEIPKPRLTECGQIFHEAQDALKKEGDDKIAHIIDDLEKKFGEQVAKLGM